MTAYYFLIMGSEDGTRIYTIPAPIDLKQVMEDYGVEKWITKVDDWDTNYWQEGSAVLLKGQMVIPKPKTVVQDWDVE